MKYGLAVFIVVAALGFSVTTFASPTKRLDPATQLCRVFTQPGLWEGRQLYQNSCKNCHFTGNSQGASFLHPGSKSMKGWNRVFYKKYPQCAQNGVWDKLSQEELMKVNDYLFRHASDTYDPYDAADCG